MKLINKELEKEVSSNKSNIREKLLEEMNKWLIFYIPIMILCMLKIKQLKKMMLFFVLQLQEIVLAIHKHLNVVIINILERYLPEFQFSVSGSGFSVLVPAPDKFNSLYRASDSLKIKK